MSTFAQLPTGAMSWEIELTTRCNSRCVGCSRQSHFFYENPYFNSKVDLDFEVFKKALSASKQISFILFCGVYGDPLLHPQIFDILEYLRSTYGDIVIMVHTNGAFGNKEFWAKLAKYFKPQGSYIKFSLDGLAESHEVFRRGTKWEHAKASAQTFIENGGRAVWKMIEFDHNRHEVEAAREISKEMKFKKFEVRPNNYFGLNDHMLKQVDLKNPPADVVGQDMASSELSQWNTVEADRYPVVGIDCRSLTTKNLYLDAHGRLWPCCWLGGLKYRPEHDLRQWFDKLVLANYESDFNFVAKHDVAQILSHPWFKKDLPETWDLKSGKTYMTCSRSCGLKCKT